MKVSEIKTKTDGLSQALKAENPSWKLSECYSIACKILNNWILCNGLNKALPYGSDNFLDTNCDI